MENVSHCKSTSFPTTYLFKKQNVIFELLNVFHLCSKHVGKHISRMNTDFKAVVEATPKPATSFRIE